MTETTVAKTLKEIDTEITEAVRTLETRRSILLDLPPGMATPTISNTTDTPGAAEPHGWLSWRGPLRYYGAPEGPSGADMLQALEAAGWQPSPLTLCQYGTWRRSVLPGLADEVPEVRRRDTLKDTTPIAPLWIEPNQHTGPEAHAFYRAPGGRLYRLSVAGPSGAAVYARRKEARGDWHFESGTARPVFPEWWHGAICEVANIGSHTRAYVDTPQGVSGAIYFEPHTEQDAFPLTPSQLLRLLEARPAEVK